MDYNNPFAGLPETNLPNNPFWGGYNQGQRTQMMQPFLNMHQQSQGIDLQQKQMKFGEESSPEAVGMRSAERQAKTQGFNFDREKALAGIETLPYETRQKIAETKNKIMSANAQPYRELFSELAGMADVLEKAPESERAGIHNALLTRWEMTHEGKSVPEAFRKYSPKTLEEMKQIQYAMVMTPAHLQQTNLEGVKGTEARKTADVKGQWDVKQAGVSAAGTVQAARINAENKPFSIQQEITRVGRVLQSPKSTPEEKAEAFDLATKYEAKIFEKDIWPDSPEAKAFGTPLMMAVNSKDQKRIDAINQLMEPQRVKAWNSYLVRQGLLAPVVNAQGQKGFVAKHKLAEKLKQGYKEGK